MALSQYFEAKKRLYPQSAKGKIRNIKWLLNSIFLLIYLGTPFLRWDRGINNQNQAILIDIKGSKGYFFGIEMWPDEVYYLMAILVLAAVILFFITSLFGRIWCGYACFQTVWTDLFIAVEKIFQGDRNKRIILDRKNSFEKFYKKILTHLTWILIGLITGYGFTNYFSDAYIQFKQLLNFELSLNVILWTAGIGAMTYIMAGFAREHVCTFMCPYARFQSAMFDRDTLIIAYDEKRGEPRGKLKTKDFSLEPEIHQGDCIDCKQCVVVCPTGIDIRDGLQMECIACGLCIDACNEVMEKINRPKGLIRYETQRHIEENSDNTKFRILRPRFFFYSFIISAVSFFLLYSLATKSNLEIASVADRNPPYVLMSDGSIRNGYQLKMINKENYQRHFEISVLNPKQAKLKILGQKSDIKNIKIKANNSQNFKIFITLPYDFLKKNKNSSEGIVKIQIKETSKNNNRDLEIRTQDLIFVTKR